MKVNEWKNSLEIGKIGERFTIKHSRKIILPIIDQYLYSKHYEFDLDSENREKQRQGIDGKIKLNFAYDVKTRTQKWNDILLETISVIENNVLGWFFTSKADALVYLFLNNKQNIDDGFVILLKQARKYFTEDILENYPIKIATTKKGTQIYHTENRAIPFEDFPKKSFIHIQFNKKQIKLTEFVKENEVSS
ncbi:MAG: hypothetical protein ACFFDF_22705 [Candidatus Odinarchaeota archaeon]